MRECVGREREGGRVFLASLACLLLLPTTPHCLSHHHKQCSQLMCMCVCKGERGCESTHREREAKSQPVCLSFPSLCTTQLIVAAALFLASKAMDGPRPVAHVAHAYFKVKNANKPEELAALARDPVCV